MSITTPRVFFLFVFSFSSLLWRGSGGEAFSQSSWTLKQCIAFAIDHNIRLKQAELNTKLAEENLLQSKANVLPSVNAFGNNILNFGQTIDPFTNQFASEQVRSNSFGISSNLTLFNGFQNLNGIRQSQFNAMVSRYDAERTKNDISLQIATGYLQVLFSEELLAIAQNQFALSRQQGERMRKLVDAGAAPKSNFLQMEAQLSMDELNVVNAGNQLDIAYLSLKQLSGLDSVQDFRIAKPDIKLPDEISAAHTPGQIMDAALTSRPEIKSAEFRVLGAQKGLAVSKGLLSPRVILNGSYGTGYSGLRKEITGTKPNGFNTVGQTSKGDLVYVPSYTYDYQVRSFGDQLKDNLNQSIGLTVTLPVFNQLSARNNINRAKIARQTAEYDLQLAKEQLRRNIQQAYSDAVAALKKYKATEKSMEAFNESFKYAEQRFSVGAINTVEYTDAKNKLMKAQSEQLQAKYDYVFKTKVLDFYQGKPLAF